jgi:hypothetical protein
MKYLRHVLRSTPALLALLILGLAPPASAHQEPPGCNGSGIAISIFAFFADGVTPAVGVNATECETLVFKAAIGYASQPPGNCAFQDGHLLIRTPDGVQHDVTPPGGIDVAGAPLSPGSPGPIVGLPVTYVVNPNDVILGQVIARTSYNQDPNFSLGISHTGPGANDSVGFNNGGSSIGVSIAPCPDTFCAPGSCDPAATSPQFPGRQGLCVLDAPPVCPGDDCNTGSCDTQTQACVRTPVNDSTVCDSDANGNPVPDPAGDCVHPGCEAGVCVASHVVDPDSTVCTDIDPADGVCAGCEAGVCVQTHVPDCVNGNCGNRGMIGLASRRTPAQRNAAGTQLDGLRLAMRPLNADIIDPSDKDVTVEMSNANGVFYSVTLPAGSLKLSGHYYKYKNEAARKTGGISRLTIWRKRGGRNQIYVDAWGNLSGATAEMDSSVTIGGTVYHHDGTWTPISSGWKLPLSSGQ